MKFKFDKPAKRGPKPRKPVRKVRVKKPGIPTLGKLDDLARPLCKARGRCEAEGFIEGRTMHKIACSGSLQWAHIVSRSYHRVRYLPENCLLLCAAHHVYWTFHPIEWEWFLFVTIGEESLRTLKHRATHDPKLDRREVKGTLLAWALLPGQWINPMVIST